MGSEAVRTVRVLPVGSIATASSTVAAEPVVARACASADEASVKKAETASASYRQALAAHKASKKALAVDLAIAATGERQNRAQAREPEELVGDG